MINKVILIGNVGQDPEVRKVNDTKVASFSLATTRNWKNQNGEKQSKTEWHNIVIWRKLAEVVEKFVKKGSKLYLEGEINYESYEKDGQTKYITKIICHSMQMLDSKGEQNSQPAEAQAQKTAENWNNSHNSGDDLPF